MNFEEELRTYLAGRFQVGTAAAPIPGDADLFALVDSIQILRIVAHLEKTHRIRIDDRELIPENLRSIEQLVALVDRKRQHA